MTGVPRAGIRSVEPPRDHPRQHRRPERALGHLHRLQRRHPDREQRDVALRRPSTASTSPTAATARSIRRNHVWDNRANGIHMNGDVSQGGDGIISGALVERQHDLRQRAWAAAPASTATASAELASSATTSCTTTTPAASRSTRSTPRSQTPATTQVAQQHDRAWRPTRAGRSTSRTASTGNVAAQQHLCTTSSRSAAAIAISADSPPGFVSDYERGDGPVLGRRRRHAASAWQRGAPRPARTRARSSPRRRSSS